MLNTKQKSDFTVKTRPQHRWRHAVYGLFTLIIGAGVIFSAYYLIKYKIEIDATDTQVAEAQEEGTVTEVEDSLLTEIIENGEAEDSPYWDYVEEDLMSVDFSSLKEANSDVSGWVKVPGTRIDYPFVQGSDNDYYLSHSLDRSENSAGWVYLDYREHKSFTNNQNTILYAHGRVDGSMFGTLKTVLTEEWFNDTSNHIVKTSTAAEDAIWQVFSVYRTEVTNDYLQTEFSSQDEYVRFLEMLQGRSKYAFDAKVTGADRIITLSTCIGTNERVVLHAKLIKLLRH